MQRSLLLAFALICVSSSVFAQAGSIGVFTDCDATDCNFVDTGVLVQVYIVHVHPIGVVGSTFKLAIPTAWTHLGDTWFGPMYVYPPSTVGISLIYGGCFTGTICLGVVNIFGANVPPCTYFGIVPDPAATSGLIEAYDCATPKANKMYPTGGQGVVNADETCMCDVPVEDTTWGGVKALYR